MWKPSEIGTVIAERELGIETPDGQLQIVIRFGMPVREPDPDESAPWFCPLAVDGIDELSFLPTPGDDSVQAIVLAFKLVSHLLPLYLAKRGWKISESDDFGDVIFGPEPPNS